MVKPNAEAVPLVANEDGTGEVQERRTSTWSHALKVGSVAGVVLSALLLGAVLVMRNGGGAGLAGGLQTVALGEGGKKDQAWLGRHGRKHGKRGGGGGADSDDLPAYSAPADGKIVNRAGGLPGLLEHVESVTDTTKFRLISFCNEAYWPFSHTMLESLRVVGPTLIPYWTIIVADKKTQQIIEAEAPEVDVFVDQDLQHLVSSSSGASSADLRNLLSWRRVHALYGLVKADYTAVFVEPDVMFAKDPLQLFHDVLMDADIITSSDYGWDMDSLNQVNTKVIVAKPSDEAKKLLEVWQLAEPTYEGEDAEKGYYASEIVSRADQLDVSIKAMGQGIATNYLTYTNDGGYTIITGTGCDDINYKINFLNQVLLLVLPPGPGTPTEVNFASTIAGCDMQGRTKLLGAGTAKTGKGGNKKKHGGGGGGGSGAIQL